MNAILITTKKEKRIIVSTRKFYYQMIKRFLADVYDMNDTETDNMSIVDNEWKCCGVSGTLEIIEVSTA